MKICLVCHKYAVPLSDPCAYPLGFMYVSAMLKSMEHTVKVLNYNLWDYDLKKEIKDQDRVLFTGFEEFFPYIKRDAAICKEMGIRTILGGALATFLPVQMLDHVDTVVCGESENVLEEALYETGIIQGTPVKLHEIPYPDYEGFGIEEYHKRHGFSYMGILTSRGCPHRCTFCSQTCHYQVRKLKDVFTEIDFYRDRYECSRFVFNDNTINVNRDRFLALCEGLKERGISWGAAIRADVWDKEITKAAKESGCRYVVVGVESFNQARLDKMHKDIKVEQIVNTLNLLHESGIEYSGNILVGFEDETYEDILADLYTIPPYYKVFPVLVQPFIGTQNARTRKITKDECDYLNGKFREFIYEKGKYMYPEIPDGGLQ